jgi:prepilin-type processing-associated H-X9-DG protein
MAGCRLTGGRSGRRGFTLVEALVGLGIIVVIILISIPVIFRMQERFRRKTCEGNLRKIGMAIESYRSSNNDNFPMGSRYGRDSAFGGTWWLDILTYTDHADTAKAFKESIPSSGQFNGSKGNQNIKVVDGLRVDYMFCPSSSLARGSDPEKSESQATRQLLGRTPEGIPVASYVAISGSAPDKSANGRNTRESKYGILSSSGVFPPNQRINAALIRDGAAQTIAIGEQSLAWSDPRYDDPVPYDLRSGWPDGAFTGSGGNYAQLGAKASGIDGTGDQRVPNSTTVRYKVNTGLLQSKDSEKINPGFLAHSLVPYPVAKKDEPPLPPVPQIPALPGPGHNHGINSAHPGGAQVLFADGTVHWISDDIDLNVLLILCTRDDSQQPTGF